MQSRFDSRATRRFEPLEARQLLAGDLIAHWNANDLADSHAVGDPIVSWGDSVSAVEAAASGAPEFVNGVFGGRPAIRFVAKEVNDGFKVPKEASPLNGAEDFT
ncbi:MAG: hypothetical protein KDB27_18795, partial [Planctomycetales bacterium]|nr:hypothetical protein [Planctomycetales bacterium]